MIRTVLRAVAGGLAAFLLHAPALAADAASLRLDWIPLGYHAPFYYGVAKGYYREAGIDLKVEDGKGSATTANLVGTGADDFGFADATTVARMISEGLPVKIAMGVFQRSGLSLFYRKGAMAAPKDLAGKRISSCAGDSISSYMPAYLGKVGLKMSDVQMVLVDCSVKYAAVAQGRADAAASYGMAGKPLMAAVNIPESGQFDFAEVGVKLPSHGIVVSNAKLKAQPDLVKRFVAATARSWREAMRDPDGAVAATVAARPLMQGKEALLRATLIESYPYLGGTSGKPFGWQSPDEWKETAAIVEAITQKKVPPTQFYTNEAHP